MVPLYQTWPAHSDVNHYGKPERDFPLAAERDGEEQRGYRSVPWFHSSFSGLSHEGLSVLLHYISSARYPTAGRLFLHTATPPTHTKYIYHPAVCCRWAPLAGFALLARVQETGWREEGRERNQSKQFCSRANSRWKTNGGKTENSSNQYTSLLIKQTW